MRGVRGEGRGRRADPRSGSSASTSLAHLELRLPVPGVRHTFLLYSPRLWWSVMAAGASSHTPSHHALRLLSWTCHSPPATKCSRVQDTFLRAGCIIHSFSCQGSQTYCVAAAGTGLPRPLLLPSELRLRAEKGSHMFMQRRQGDLLERRAAPGESWEGEGGQTGTSRRKAQHVRPEGGGGGRRGGAERVLQPCRLSEMLGFIHMRRAMGI